jgi:hypothetical protein
MGQGSIESDDGSGMVYSNSRKVSVLPHELPELIQSLLKSASDIQPSRDDSRQQQQQPLNLIRKRSVEEKQKSEANQKRHVDSQGNELDKKSESSVDKEKTTTRVASIKREDKKVVEVTKENVATKAHVDLDDKISDAEFTESLKNIKRRRDVSFASELDSSVTENDENDIEQDRSLRSDDDIISQEVNDASAESE